MKTIFLDMDGVLNHTLFFRGRTKYPAKTIKRPYDQIDQESVENLNTLIQQTGAKVVISSTWRKHYDVAQMQEILNTFGFIGEIIDSTPSFGVNYTVRGNEILHWIKQNFGILGKDYSDYREYVILDDDSDMLLWQKDNYIKIDGYCGLTPTNVYHATRILNMFDKDINSAILNS